MEIKFEFLFVLITYSAGVEYLTDHRVV